MEAEDESSGILQLLKKGVKKRKVNLVLVETESRKIQKKMSEQSNKSDSSVHSTTNYSKDIQITPCRLNAKTKGIKCEVNNFTCFTSTSSDPIDLNHINNGSNYTGTPTTCDTNQTDPKHNKPGYFHTSWSPNDPDENTNEVSRTNCETSSAINLNGHSISKLTDPRIHRSVIRPTNCTKSDLHTKDSLYDNTRPTLSSTLDDTNNKNTSSVPYYTPVTVQPCREDYSSISHNGGYVTSYLPPSPLSSPVCNTPNGLATPKKYRANHTYYNYPTQATKVQCSDDIKPCIKPYLPSTTQATNVQYSDGSKPYLQDTSPLQPYSSFTPRSKMYPSYSAGTYKTCVRQSPTPTGTLSSTPHRLTGTLPSTTKPSFSHIGTEAYVIHVNQMLELNRKHEVEFQQMEYATNMVKTLEEKKMQRQPLNHYEANVLQKCKEYLYHLYHVQQFHDMYAYNKAHARNMNLSRVPSSANKNINNSQLTPPPSPLLSTVAMALDVKVTSTQRRDGRKVAKNVGGKAENVRYNPY